MRRRILGGAIIALLLVPGCGSLKGLGVPNISGVDILSSPANQRTYQADYDKTFRASVDALRQLDNGSAKFVKYDAGIIIFQQPDGSGKITANVERIDEKSTKVEVEAKKEKKFWFDSSDKALRDAFFAELDKRLGAQSPAIEKTAEREAKTSLPQAARPEHPAEEKEKKDPLLAKLGRELNLAGENNFLDKLSYEELSLLDRELEQYRSISEANEKVSKKCAACYIDLARVYHDSGQYARSAEALKIAISIEPDNAVAHCSLGEIYKHLGLFDDAIRELNESMRLNPDLADAYVNLGIIYDDYVIDDQKALELYKKYLTLGGSDRQVVEWIKAIEDGS